MAKLTRKTAKIFGETATATGADPEIGQFGSAKVGTYVGTTDIDTIQALSAWSNGWIDAVTPTHQFPTLPEMTGVHKVLSYQNAYILQQGMPEWDVNTTYYYYNYCSYEGIIYKSISDENINNQPDVSPSHWEIYGAISDYANQDLSNLTNFGNARLQYVPFAVNNGKTSNGENVTLDYGEGGSPISYTKYAIPVLDANTTDYGTCSNYKFTYTTYSSSYLSNTTWSMDLSVDNYIPANTVVSFNLTSYRHAMGSNALAYCTGCKITYTYIDDTTEIVFDNNTAFGSIAEGKTKEIVETCSTSTNIVKKVTLNAYRYSAATSTDCGKFNMWYSVSSSASNTLVSNPCIMTSCDGRTETFYDSPQIDVTSVANGSYHIFKNFSTGALSLVSNFTISKTAPVSPSNGDYWLDISTVPANLKIYDSAWGINNDYVCLGDCTVSSGTLTNILNMQFNFNGFWEVANLPDYSKKIGISGSYTAKENGWIVNASLETIKPIYKGETYTASSGQYFAPMKGY